MGSGLVGGRETGGVVAAALGGAGAAGSSPRVVGRDPQLHGGRIVGAHGRGDQAVAVVLGLTYPEIGLVGDLERPQVHAALAVGQRDPGLLQGHQLVESGQEQLLGQRRHLKPLRGSGEPRRVPLGTEQPHRPIGVTVGLQSLEDLLAVVEHRSRRVQLPVAGGDDAGVMPPHALGVVGDGHVVGEELPEHRIRHDGGALGLGRRMVGAVKFKQWHVRRLVDETSPRTP